MFKFKRAVAAIAALGFVMSTPGVADASHSPEPPADVEILGTAGDWIRFSGPYGFVYGAAGAAGDPIFVITGGTIEDVCGFGVDVPPANIGKVRQRSDGKWTVRMANDAGPTFVSVYERPDGVPDIFAWFGMVCPAMGGGAPAPDVLATGNVSALQDSVTEIPAWFSFLVPQPDGKHFNGVRGVVTMADGQRAYLNAQARFTIDGGPPVFQRHFVKLTPRG